MNLCSMSLAYETEGYVFPFYNVRVTLNLHTFEQVKLFFYKAVDAIRLVVLVVMIYPNLATCTYQS